MKRVLIFALTLLLATTGLVLTVADAFDYDWRKATFWGKVWGETYVHTKYDSAFKIATSSHWYYLENDLGNLVKIYAISTAGVRWNGGAESPPAREEAVWVEADGATNVSETFSFNMGGKEAGPASVWGTSQLEVVNMATLERRWYPTASTSSRFDL